MTPKFDDFCNKLINEFTTAKSKRSESRYWSTSMYPKAQPRKVSTMRTKTASQRTKLGNQQYIGSVWSTDGPRGQNKSQKDVANAAIAKGLGSHLRITGTNPKKTGTAVNSKQGQMEIKYNLGNGKYKIGAANKKGFDKTERGFLKNYLKNKEDP